ncbi:hypothetical protein BJX70DRAFT_28250 [Aspergillus crustosus]
MQNPPLLLFRSRCGGREADCSVVDCCCCVEPESPSSASVSRSGWPWRRAEALTRSRICGGSWDSNSLGPPGFTIVIMSINCDHELQKSTKIRSLFTSQRSLALGKTTLMQELMKLDGKLGTSPTCHNSSFLVNHPPETPKKGFSQKKRG